MRSTASRIYKYLVFPFVVYLVLSGSVRAQNEDAATIWQIAEDICRMKECRAKDPGFPFPLMDRSKTADFVSTEGGRDAHRVFYLKGVRTTERDASLPFLKPIAFTPDHQNSVLFKPTDDRDHSSAQYDLFRNEKKGFGAKFLRASILTQTSQITNLMVMIAFPDAFNNSCRSWAEAKSNLNRAWTSPPVWDKDAWGTNFAGHPFIGSLYYNTFRSQGASPRTSFLFSTGQSLLWEYVIEAIAEQPSIQDLLFTSTLGSVFGELSHRATIRMSRNGFSTFEKILALFIDPVYVLNNGLKKRH